MEIEDDPRIKSLQEKIQTENDPAKLGELVDELTRLYDEYDAEGPGSKPAQK